MKRYGYVIIGVLVGLGFLALLGLQGRYTSMMVKMRRDQFDENVKRSLEQASRDLERLETELYLKSVVSANSDELLAHDSAQVSARGSKVLGNPILMKIVSTPDAQPKFSQAHPNVVRQPMSLRMLPTQTETISKSAKEFQRAVRNAYIYEDSLLDEVIYAVLYNASEKSFAERVNPEYLNACIRRALDRNGVSLDYHFKVCTADGRVVYKCSDYTEDGIKAAYTQPLFRNDPLQKMGFMVVHFPDRERHVFGVMTMMFPAMVFTFVLFVLFIGVLYLLFRQRKVSEMKNDFVSNMTHEFKTPIASISLAAQMLTDQSISKSAAMYNNLGNVISKESRRLRFLVEKVLQLSIYDHNNIALNMVELNSDELVDNVVKTFSINVQQTGGHIDTDLSAENPLIFVDEMHYTNVVYNVMENAVKYRRSEVPLELKIRTYNQGENYCLEIADNGIGIPKDDLKRIFERFYRVHTGNQHDVKGTGLGLAYVRQMIEILGGNIKAESTLGQGTKFIITIPNSKD